jgi:hypothetical protein
MSRIDGHGMRVARTILPNNKTSFGLCLQRDQASTFGINEQILVKSLRW